jgi:hypothetical protein
MSAMIGLASLDARVRDELAHYLTDAGFEVSQFELPPRPTSLWALVWLAERDVQTRTVERVVGSWLRPGHGRRVVVVTWRPAALRALVDQHEGRLLVLPPPVFGWQVVDALRSTDRGGPEAA